ncbi:MULTISPECIES: helix-turn-helix transcriptional regulator [Streptomyces]|uniref:Helix-turn-helix domain-containing protein n=1 Tax=Streptomyces achmelvichensis TaxID=3134111 RepID=A0ACC6Q6E9_9ACTN|nr:helix-turn-helix domain-containing protein [Streptomyces sp. NBC_01167]
MEEAPGPRSTWTFLTSHARVLSAISRDPWARIRDLAVALQLTERTVQAVIADLEEAGYLSRTREGRRNKYELRGGQFRHPAEEHRDIAPLLDILATPPHLTGDDSGANDGARPESGRQESVDADGRMS